MSLLMSSLSLRGTNFPNRVMMSPMCQHRAEANGSASEWHYVHYASRAVGGVGWILMEDTAVEPSGLLGEQILGLWDDCHIENLARIVRFCHEQGSRVGIQIAHAGRRAFSSSKGVGPHRMVAPSSIPYAEGWVVPHALTIPEIDGIVQSFASAAARAKQAGFSFVEIHGAHGYLLNQFLSPIANQRTDQYGGSLENRARLLYEVTRAVRAVWPESAPLLARLSASDLAEGGVTPDDVITVAKSLRALGVDMLDLSWGGILPHQGGGGIVAFQKDLPRAEKLTLMGEVRRQSGLPTVSAGVAATAEEAEAVIRDGYLDVVAIGRALLANPYWTHLAARELGVQAKWPSPYRVLA